MTIFLATENPNKKEEIFDIFKKNKELGIELISLSGLPLSLQKKFNPKENKDTFLENARIKAECLVKLVKKNVLSEDSGLVVPALNGRPGIHSNRYGKNDEERINRLLAEMSLLKKEQRKAWFITCVCYMDQYKNSSFFLGRVEGNISTEPKGDYGFGYDPIFYYPPYQKCFGEVPKKMKQRVSHRAKAIGKLMDHLKIVRL